MLSPLLTLIAENTLWSHMTGRKTSVSVLAGAWPAAPEDVRYQAPTVATDVVLDNTRPHDWFVPEVRSISVFACPCTVVVEAVSGVAVTVPVVAEPAVNGEPVAEESAVPPMVPRLPIRPHSVTASGPV